MGLSLRSWSYNAKCLHTLLMVQMARLDLVGQSVGRHHVRLRPRRDHREGHRLHELAALAEHFIGDLQVLSAWIRTASYLLLDKYSSHRSAAGQKITMKIATA